MTDRLLEQLGNYQLMQLIGKGGFAEVYLGRHVHLDTEAAIKVLQVQLVEDERANFLKEARTLVKLTHPHIVRVLDFGVEGDTPFLVMDYAPNGNLRTRHPGKQTLPLATIATYVEQIAEALAYAHSRHLIHRDIKPENMLVGRDNEILLSDFGTAIVAQSTQSLRNVDAIGTVAYMAPEQIEGRPHQASDQYALAVVVYEWLSGQRPFNGTDREIFAQHMQQFPPPLPAQIVPAAVAQVVLKALSKTPQERFQHIGDFAQEFSLAAQVADSAAPSSANRAQQTPLDHDAVTLLHYQKTAPLTATGAAPTPHSLAELLHTGRYQLARMIEWSKKEFGLDTYWLHTQKHRLFLNSGIVCNIAGSLLLGLRLQSLWIFLCGMTISLATFLLFFVAIRRVTTTILAIFIAAYWAVVFWGLPAHTFWISIVLFVGSLLIHLRHDARKRA